MEIRFFQTHDSPLQSLTGISDEWILWDFSTQWINTEGGGLKQKHKKQPFGDASASHLSLVLWHV